FTFVAPQQGDGRGGGRGGRGPAATPPSSGVPATPATPPAPPAPLPKLARVNTAMYDPLLGRTYAEIGADARSNHKCQGMTGLPPLPGVAGGRGGPAITGYQL